MLIINFKPAAHEKSSGDVVWAWSENLWSFSSIGSKKFRKKFGPRIPPLFDKKALSDQTRKVHQKELAKMHAALRRKDVHLLLDGATMHNEGNPVCSPSDGEQVYYLSTKKCGRMTAESIEERVKGMLDDFAERKIHVFALVADNAQGNYSNCLG